MADICTGVSIGTACDGVCLNWFIIILIICMLTIAFLFVYFIGNHHKLRMEAARKDMLLKDLVEMKL
jgi:hypothetical protein